MRAKPKPVFFVYMQNMKSETKFNSEGGMAGPGHYSLSSRLDLIPFNGTIMQPITIFFYSAQLPPL